MREFKRDRGFFTFAQNGTHDYVRMAYGLALSLKASQSEIPWLSIGVTPGTIVPKEYLWAFDEIIEIPWGDAAHDSSWKLENEWKAYHMTPYKETIKLDCDMLFYQDLNTWWDTLKTKDVWMSTTARTYRNEVITNDYYRKTFTANDLPNVYTALMYFQYSDLAQDVFQWAEIIYQNWDHFCHHYLQEPRPKEVSTDVVFALAIKLMDKIDECTDAREFMSFTHMKTKLQNWDDYFISEQWNEHVGVYLDDDLKMKIGRYLQVSPVHYHAKTVLTDDIIQTYERKLK